MAALIWLLAGLCRPAVAQSPVLASADLAQAPWRAFGRVQTELGTRCTGFLIAPRLVMTAAHCLYRPVTGHYVQPSSVHFLWRYDRGRYADHARVMSFAIAPGYDPASELATLGLDRAFLALDHPLGAKADLVEFSARLPAVGAELMTGGYNRDHDEILQTATCHLRGFRQDRGGHLLLLDDCLGEPGTSGSALFARGARGGWKVIGLNVARTGRGGRHGLAEPLTR